MIKKIKLALITLITKYKYELLIVGSIILILIGLSNKHNIRKQVLKKENSTADLSTTVTNNNAYTKTKAEPSTSGHFYFKKPSPVVQYLSDKEIANYQNKEDSETVNLPQRPFPDYE